MPRNHRAMLILSLAAGLTASLPGFACAAETDRPARVEQVPGSNLARIVLMPRAAERLALKTTPVREESVLRWLTVEAAVEAILTDIPAEQSNVTTAGLQSHVRVPVPVLDAATQTSGLAISALSLASKDDFDDDEDELVRSRIADLKDKRSPIVFVIPLTRSESAKRLRAKLMDEQPEAGASGLPLAYYLVDQQDPKAALQVGQRVQVKIPQPGSGAPKKVVPYSAVIYDSRGDTWVYVNPEPLVFARHRIDVEYVQDDVAVLNDGPANGMQVVSAGAVELHGIEQKFGN